MAAFFVSVILLLLLLLLLPLPLPESQLALMFTLFCCLSLAPPVAGARPDVIASLFNRN